MWNFISILELSICQFQTIVKPSWRPPKKAFGPVWTTLYASMGYASYLVWNASGGFGSRAMVLYGGSILLNWAWTPLFFGYHKLGAVRIYKKLFCTSWKNFLIHLLFSGFGWSPCTLGCCRLDRFGIL